MVLLAADVLLLQRAQAREMAFATRGGRHHRVLLSRIAAVPDIARSIGRDISAGQ